MNGWPFDQPPHCAVITVRQVVNDGAAIVYVTHDSDDHGWQFLGAENVKMEDALIVCFSHVVERDPSLRQLADLPPGWHAWRNGAGHPWQRAPNPNDVAPDDT